MVVVVVVVVVVAVVLEVEVGIAAAGMAGKTEKSMTNSTSAFSHRRTE